MALSWPQVGARMTQLVFTAARFRVYIPRECRNGSKTFEIIAKMAPKRPDWASRFLQAQLDGCSTNTLARKSKEPRTQKILQVLGASRRARPQTFIFSEAPVLGRVQDHERVCACRRISMLLSLSANATAAATKKSAEASGL